MLLEALLFDNNAGSNKFGKFTVFENLKYMQNFCSYVYFD